MMAQGDRLNFRCSTLLRKRLNEAAQRSNVTVSEQARVSLEELYDAKEESKLWLPEVLRDKKPSSKRPTHEHNN